MDDGIMRFPHVREYFIPREEYLTIIRDSSMYLFYSNIDWYESSRIQAGVEPEHVTMSGRLCAPDVDKISKSNILIDVAKLDGENEYTFLAKFNAPHRNANGKTDLSWQDDFSLISAQWTDEGIRMRFNLKSENFRQWHYFSSIEPYLVQQPNIIYSVDNQFTAVRFSEGVHQTIFTAYHQGYFESPRKVGLRELAKQLGVSHMSVSRNLREFERLIVENYVKG